MIKNKSMAFYQEKGTLDQLFKIATDISSCLSYAQSKVWEDKFSTSVPRPQESQQYD